MGFMDMARRKAVRDSARVERMAVHEQLSALYFQENHDNVDCSREIAELNRQVEILNFAVKHGEYPS